ncbi:cell surface A33 antigen-like isoform X2 [Chanodichthys erythropterus]|uniref:cell surface A33 antigen-like isoform X2 n=1 Tax=Chanodichthys erythropterus TaxID=933992 RepID=UPI00351EA195
MAYIKMWIFLNILSFLHYLITACTPSDSGVTKITAFSGESVLLPCTCTNTQDKPKSFSWETKSRRASKDGIYIDIFSVFELYRNRITLLNQTSPGNVSLLLSDLTEDDQGSYVCLLETTSRFIDVFVKMIGGAAVIYYIHRAHKKARMETGKINVENNLDDHNSTYGILQRKYDAEEMYGTIGNRPKDQ